MVTNDLGACEWFVWDLRRSGLIDRGQLDQIVGEFLKRNPRAEAPALAEHLVSHGTLTAFQAERILNGKTQGLVLGPYVLMDAIGQGSMGQVYKASSKNDQNLYAVKVLPRRSMWNVRLARRQVRSFGLFTHPAVVPFVDVGTAGGLHYLVWPLAEGQTLEAIVQQHGRLSPQQTALLGVQVAQGMTSCHQNNIFHGLLKPSNIMIGPDNQSRILDFGIGSLLVENEGESLVDTMSTANTLTSGLDCASPESIMEPTNRTPAGDQYSLGCVLYYCLTGRPPFPEGSAVEKMMAHQTKDPTPIRELAPDTPDGLVEVVVRLMAKQPEQRFSGTDEVVEALEPYVMMGEMDAPAPAPQPARPTGNSRAAMPGLGAKPVGATAPSSNPGNRGFSVPQSPAVATPSPFGGGGRNPVPQAAPAPAARAGGFGGGMASPGGGGGGGFGPPAAQQVPARGGGGAMPNRASFNQPAPQPQYEQEVPLMPAAPQMPQSQSRYDPAALRASAGWVAEMDDEMRSRGGGGSSGILNTVAIIVVAIVVMVLVFLGLTMILRNNQQGAASNSAAPVSALVEMVDSPYHDHS